MSVCEHVCREGSISLYAGTTTCQYQLMRKCEWMQNECSTPLIHIIEIIIQCPTCYVCVTSYHSLVFQPNRLFYHVVLYLYWSSVWLCSQCDMETRHDMFGRTPTLLLISNVFCMLARALTWCHGVGWNYHVWRLESERDLSDHNNFLELFSVLRKHVCLWFCVCLWIPFF